VCAGELVLIVDDEPTVLEIIGATLEVYGYRVLTASDGAEGLRVFRERGHEIRVVLSDINMPVMSGDVLIHEIRQLNPSIAVIATSGSGEEHNQAMLSIKRGIRLAKPYTVQELLRALRQAVSTPT
jgi:two-component system cell cycle sensor histidine kinase/response regulator CckA